MTAFDCVLLQVVTLLAVQLGFTDDVSPGDMTSFIARAYNFVKAAAPQVSEERTKRNQFARLDSNIPIYRLHAPVGTQELHVRLNTNHALLLLQDSKNCMQKFHTASFTLGWEGFGIPDGVHKHFCLTFHASFGACTRVCV